jgi:protein involved in polysaccharide export with SLBB domain
MQSLSIMLNPLRVLALAALLVSSAYAARAFAQDTPEVTDEQLQILEGLPPEQREAIIEEVMRARESVTGEKRERGAMGREERGEAPEVRPLTPKERTEREKRLLREKLRELEEETDPTLKPLDTIIVELKLREPSEESKRATTDVNRSEFETNRLTALRDRILARNPYRLDDSGQLRLPGFEPLALLGLTAEAAAQRLAADKDFSEFDVKITRLDLLPVGDEALKPFGYDLFTDAPTTFLPETDIPVPPDYVVGPGDELRVQLFGNTNRTLTLTVGRNGAVNLPEIGPIAVAGQKFSAAKEAIESRVSSQMIGVRAHVEMGETRAIRIFLLGEVEMPGSYTVSGLATITNALFAGGGITRLGSLRNVQLKRNGQLVRTLDLYDLLLRGDTSDDARLLPGDVVFIPPIGPTVSINGEILRPAIYELRPSTTVGDLVALAGGFTPKADARQVRLEQLNARGERSVTNLDLASDAARAKSLANGDFVRVLRLRDTLEGGVTVAGHVYNVQPFEFRPGLRLTDVLRYEDLKPRADTHYILIRRELAPDRKIMALSADLAAALTAPGSSEDVLLAPRDQLTVFDIDSSRDRIVSGVLIELRAQATYDQPLQAVIVGGRVRAPGQYPLEPDMRISDLIRAGGSLEDAAYGGEAELSRYEVVNGEYRQTELIDIDLAAVLRGDAAADISLRPYDALNIKEVPQWRELETVSVEGEVRFPGLYPIQRGETLRQVLQRAGGLTDLAFPNGAVFTRETLRKREQEQLDRLSERLRRDLAVLALQGAQSGGGNLQALSVGEGLLAELQGSRAIGRLVIDLNQVLAAAPGGAQDIVLKNGDRLLVPKQNQEVTVIGEVQNATSHRYIADLGRDDYLSMSGGLTNQADEDRIYVVRANGSVVASSGGAWFSRSSEDMEPGDTVVVPLDAGKMRALPLWAAVTTIIYNLAVAVAAVNSF